MFVAILFLYKFINILFLKEFSFIFLLLEFYNDEKWKTKSCLCFLGHHVYLDVTTNHCQWQCTTINKINKIENSKDYNVIIVIIVTWIQGYCSERYLLLKSSLIYPVVFFPFYVTTTFLVCFIKPFDKFCGSKRAISMIDVNSLSE